MSVGLGSNEKIIADLSAIIGKLAGPSSLALSVISLFLATLPKPFLERLRFELDKNQYSFIKITLFDVNPSTEEIVGGYNIDDFKIEKISDYENKVMDIYGEKYWIGEFGMISKIKPNPNSNKSTDEQIRDNIKKIFNEIEKYLDNKVNSNGKK